MKKTLLLSLLALFSLSIFSQEPVIDWKIDQSRADSGSHILKISAKIPHDWYIYGMNMEEGGPLPLFLSFEDVDNTVNSAVFKEISKPKQMFDEVFDMNVNTYMEYVEIECEFVPKGDLSDINLIIDGQACNKKDGSCVQVYKLIKIEIMK